MSKAENEIVGMLATCQKTAQQLEVVKELILTEHEKGSFEDELVSMLNLLTSENYFPDLSIAQLTGVIDIWKTLKPLLDITKWSWYIDKDGHYELRIALYGDTSGGILDTLAVSPYSSELGHIRHFKSDIKGIEYECVYDLYETKEFPNCTPTDEDVTPEFWVDLIRRSLNEEVFLDNDE